MKIKFLTYMAYLIAFYFVATAMITMFRFSPVYYFFTNKWYQTLLTQDLLPYWETQVPYYALIKKIPITAQLVGVDADIAYLETDAKMMFYPRRYAKATLANIHSYDWILTTTTSIFYSDLNNWIIHHCATACVPHNSVLLERKKS